MITVTFSNLADTIGIDPLTGEACAFSMRILCNVNDEGASIVRDFMGLPSDCPMQPAWNSTVASRPAIGSVMLHRDAFPALVHFALMRKGCQYVYGRDDHVNSSGFSDTDLTEYPDLKDYIDGSARRAGFDQGARLYVNPTASRSNPYIGTRNVHAMSGRTT